MTDTPAFVEVLARAIPADGTTLDTMRAALWDTPAGRTMINKGDVVLYWLNEADVARAALAAAPQPMGCGLPCGFDCNGACFDAAAPQPEETHECPVCEETVTWTGSDRPYCGVCAADNGRDVKMRPIAAAPQPVPDREACRAKQAEPDRGSDETPYDRGYVWGYRHGLRDGKSEAAPQPAPVDREALVAAVRNARVSWANDGNGESCPDEAIADWLIEHGLLLPVDPQAAEPLIEDIVSRVSEWDDRTSPEDWPEALLITADELREELRELARGLRLPGGDETMAWAVVGEGGEILLNSVKKDRSKAERYIFDASERLVRVAIRVVEGGDDE